jgi:hypothetical protein
VAARLGAVILIRAGAEAVLQTIRDDWQAGFAVKESSRLPSTVLTARLLIIVLGALPLLLDALFLPVFWARALSRDLAPAVVFFLFFFTISLSSRRRRLACYTPVHSNGTRT